MRFFFFLIIFMGLVSVLTAQKVLQLEKYGKAKTEKLFIGDEFTYKLKDSPQWHTAVIEDLHIEQNKIVLAYGFIELEQIEALRFYRPGVNAAGKSLFVFGTSWSFFAFVGGLTSSEHDYRWSDAAVTGTSYLLAWSIPKLFGHKKFKIGERKRLRMLDLTFKIE